MTTSPVLIFATQNAHKTAEIRNVAGDRIRLITLKEAGIDIDIPEPHDTLEANAREKSKTIHRMTQQNCLGEDTGLEVTFLQGAPGVKSARYAGEGRNSSENREKLLTNLQGAPDRSARFRTILSLVWENREYQFEGNCTGQIALSPRGDLGFGYDPIFIPDGSTQTFAEMSLEEKNRFSHRRKATDQLVTFLLDALKK